MSNPDSAQRPSEERGLMELARDLENLEAIVEGWDPQQAGTARAIKTTVEELLVGAGAKCEDLRDIDVGHMGLATSRDARPAWLRIIKWVEQTLGG